MKNRVTQRNMLGFLRVSIGIGTEKQVLYLHMCKKHFKLYQALIIKI